MANGEYVTALHNHFQNRQEGHLLSWKEYKEGLPHALKWTAEWKVRGEIVGSATADQLRIAKEKAAQYACQRLGISA